MITLHLSRRNLQILLSKLDRKKNGEETVCTIIKNKDVGGKYENKSAVTVIAVEDGEYYATRGRPAGDMHPTDEALITKTGETND